jgi:glycosyltransferase involved in cell wall biosynthesis
MKPFATSMRRLVFVSTMEGSPWGGSEELWSHAALVLQEDGLRVSASVPHSPGPRPVLTRLQEAGIDVHSRRPGPSVLERAWRKATRQPWGQLPRGETSWLEKQRADLVCISQGGIADGLSWMLHCRRSGIPYAPIVHSNAEWLWPDDAQGEQMAMAYRSAATCFFVSERNRQLLEDQIGEELTAAALVRNPFKVPSDATPAWPASDPDWRLACVARLDPVAKGQDVLLRVLGAEKWRRRNLKVNFYGTGRCERSLHQLASRLALTNVQFKGHVANVERIWAEHHALVLPSRYEGTPLALVEAMFCGRPCIVTDVAGNPELVEHGVSGFVACGASVNLLDCALEDAWQRRYEWQQMGARAREQIASLVPANPVRQFCDLLMRVGDRPAGLDARREV